MGRLRSRNVCWRLDPARPRRPAVRDREDSARCLAACWRDVRTISSFIAASRCPHAAVQRCYETRYVTAKCGLRDAAMKLLCVQHPACVCERAPARRFKSFLFDATSSSALAGLRMGASSQSFSNWAFTPTNFGTLKNVGESQSMQSKLRQRRTLDDDEEEEYCDSCAEQVWLCFFMMRRRFRVQAYGFRL